MLSPLTPYLSQSHTGMQLRLEMLSRCLDPIMFARRFDMARLLLPPGPSRIGFQFMLPQIGLITPVLELPEKRYRLFLSRSTVGYTRKEILSWYSDDQMDEDDVLLAKAEIAGQKRRLYLEWLLKEDDRRLESQEMMLDEDRVGRVWRSYWIELEQKMEAFPMVENPTATAFAFLGDLPGEYQYIQTETTVFEHGSGLHNDDELEDLKEAAKRAAEKVST